MIEQSAGEFIDGGAAADRIGRQLLRRILLAQFQQCRNAGLLGFLAARHQRLCFGCPLKHLDLFHDVAVVVHLGTDQVTGCVAENANVHIA